MADLVTITEALEQSTLSHEQIANLARKGRITARKSGVVWLIDPDSLREYEERMKKLGPLKHHPNPPHKL